MQLTHDDMVLRFERTVFDGLHGSVIESIKALNILNGSCSCVNTLRGLLHFGDIKTCEDSVRSLNERYDQRIADGNRNESGKKMHDAEWPSRSRLD